ncbi:pilus assembly protein TadG-related protein [Streptomyces sp. VRA16 Mangrove soil]|uniref:pilus assembly protein TadG-related protein n=1 Tax=Streptomyces sp. VRA16 Mangrove soil TaxID=2817434 RepID=UPI00227716ED|nr:pilus assembly protein TadG-related protein [Streptomyces sp. VRA16 Mangrove soil]
MSGDLGSTLPIYIWLTGILLFAAFAFFAFAQAASARNGAQSAADAAALAAAQSARDELMDGLGQAIGDGDDWLGWLRGQGFEGADAQAAAGQLAADNDADVVAGPDPAEVDGFPGYRVEVLTRYTVGDSIIPGTENKHAKAHATAVIQPRCEIPDDADFKKPVQLTCEGDQFEIDPKNLDPGDLPDASALFSVHLAD